MPSGETLGHINRPLSQKDWEYVSVSYLCSALGVVELIVTVPWDPKMQALRSSGPGDQEVSARLQPQWGTGHV